MLLGITGDGAGAQRYDFRSLDRPGAARTGQARPDAQADPPARSADPPGGDIAADLIADTVATSLMTRLYDSAGVSHSLTQEQFIQAGEIDARR